MPKICPRCYSKRRPAGLASPGPQWLLPHTESFLLPRVAADEGSDVLSEPLSDPLFCAFFVILDLSEACDEGMDIPAVVVGAIDAVVEVDGATFIPSGI